MLKKSILLLPMNSNIFIVKKGKKNCIFIQNEFLLYHFIININLNTIFFNKNFNFIMFNNINTNKKKMMLYNNFFINWDNFFFKKIKINGKGFKIQKRKKIINLFINFSNPILLLNKNFIIKKTEKSKLIFYFNNNKYIQFIYKFIQLRELNIYTKRGIRPSRYLITNKKGKISSK